MLMLALESSAKAASAAVFENGRLLGLTVENSGLTHSRTLLPMAEDLLRNLDRAVDALDVVAVACGPGSFTGLRIGMAEAKGLCWALQLPAVGVSTLEGMAFGGPDREGEKLCCVMDARRGQVYNALFEVRDGRPVRLTKDRAIALSDLAPELLGSGGVWTLVGDGAELCRDTLFNLAGLTLTLAPEPLRVQNARGVGLAALGREPRHVDELLPVYLRLSQAERERQSRLNAQTTKGG